ncbi:MAG TPA: hypothetical protein VIL85_03390 [Thermomicrobiales bacterium]|jgi:hypothetical protein
MSRFWYRKGVVWMRRYLPAELLGTLCAIVGGLLVGAGSPLVAALGGTWGENLGYYGTVITRDLRARRAQGGRLTPGGVLRSLRNIALEFGGAELLDSFLIRPGAMYAAIRLTGSVPLGLLLGKLAADLAFYIPTIIAYELRVRFLGD